MSRHATLLLLAFLPAAAGADEFSDFRIPDHRVHSVTGSFQGNFSRNHNSQDLGPSARLADFSGLLDVSGSWLHDSERGVTSLSAFVRTDGVRSYRNSRSEYFLAPVSFHSLNTDAGDSKAAFEAYVLDALWRRYFWEAPIGIELSVTGSANLRQEWMHDNQGFLSEDPTTTITNRLTSESQERARDLYLVGRATVGYGKVRDATGVFAARVLEQRLRALGVLARPLGAEAARKLAGLFYVEGDFLSVHDRPDKYFWGEVEKILREDGALRDQGLDAFAVNRALEPLIAASPGMIVGSNYFRRDAGYFVGVGASGYHQEHRLKTDTHSRFVSVVDGNPPTISENTYSSTTRYGDDLVLIGPSVEVHRPVGIRWQLDAGSTLGFAFQTKRVDEALRWGSFASGVFAISDRWYWTAQASHLRDYASPPGATALAGSGVWVVSYGSGVSYFLEDQVILSLGVIEQQARTSTPGLWGFTRMTRAQLGMTYRFLGAADAPGLISPVRRVVGGR